MLPYIAEIVWMMNKHCGGTRELVAVGVEILHLREGKREQKVTFHPAVIDGGARGVKGGGLTEASSKLG